MSEYVEVSVRNMSLYWFRNYLKDDIVSLLFSKRNLFCFHNQNNDPEDEDSVQYTQYVFKASVKEVKERLDAQGYSLYRFEKIFDEKAKELLYYDAFLNHLHVNDDYEKIAEARIQKNVTFLKWKNAIKKIISYELDNGNVSCYNKCDDLKKIINNECEKVIYYSLLEEERKYYYAMNIEAIPIGYVFRIILENCNLNDEVVLDFTNLINWSYDYISKDISFNSEIERTIVLVEGKSDKDILEFALDNLYPHLFDLFYFMDFDDGYGGKRDGGTSYLIKNFKTFYFSKIKTRFIAIFDNDAEGYISKCSLENDIKTWPDNFRILKYPDEKIFKTFPTLMPNGAITNDNINGKACSIELYLPDELITDKGEYYPVEWEARKIIKTNDINHEYLYQGVVSNKEEIKDKFYKLKIEIKNNKKSFVKEDWKRINDIIDSIVFAFCK